MSAPEFAVVADRLIKRFGRLYAVRGVSLSLARSSVLLVIGPNGSGKTTLLRMLATALRPTAGYVSIFGLDLMRDAGEIRRNSAFVPAGAGVYEGLTARENLAFAAAMSGVKADPGGWLARVGLADAPLPVRTLSQGMKRRLALAAAWLRSPTLLLLDEPFSGLDQDGQQIVERMIADVKLRGGSVVIATHEWERGKRVADVMITLAGGGLIDSAALPPASPPPTPVGAGARH